MSSISKNRQLHNKIKKIKGKLGGEEKIVDFSKELKKHDVIWIKSLLAEHIPNIQNYTTEELQDLMLQRNWYSDVDILNYVALKNNLDEYVSRLNEEIVTSRIDNILESK